MENRSEKSLFWNEKTPNHLLKSEKYDNNIRSAFAVLSSKFSIPEDPSSITIKENGPVREYVTHISVTESCSDETICEFLDIVGCMTDTQIVYVPEENSTTSKFKVRIQIPNNENGLLNRIIS